MLEFYKNFKNSQVKKLGLNIKEGHILDWIISTFNSGNFQKKIIDNKHYFWLTYSKVCEEPLLEIGLHRSRQIINMFCDIGILEKLESNSTKKYYRVLYEKLAEEINGFTTIIGVDTSLAFYLPIELREKHISKISYNSDKIIYFSSSFTKKHLEKLNNSDFKNSVLIKLKKLLGAKTFYYFSNCKWEFKNNSIIIKHNNTPEVVLNNIAFKIERALVDAYIGVIYGTEDVKIQNNTAEIIEFSKLFKKLHIDCNLDSTKYNLDLLTTKIKESTYLKSFTTLSQILRKYKEIISDKYKDFNTSNSNNNNKKPIKRAYSEEELNDLYDNIYDVNIV